MFLECVEDNLLTQLVSEPARGRAQLDLLFVSREERVGDVVVGGCFGHSYSKMNEFKGTGSADLPPWTSKGQTLSCLGAWLTESLRRQSERAERARKATHSSRRKS